MEFEQILALIGNYAFPICCCVYLFYSMAKEREEHKEEMSKVTDALNNNTVAITELREMVRSNGRG